MESLTFKRPSVDAAPPGINFVMKIDGSMPVCGLSVPPAIENPNPDVPRSNVISSYCQLSSPFTCEKQLSQNSFKLCSNC